MTDVVTLEESTGRGITLTHSSYHAAIQLVLFVGFFGFWYWALASAWVKDTAHRPVLVPFLVFPAFFGPMGARLVRSFRGLTYSFSPVTRAIAMNEDRIAGFDDVERLEVRARHGEETEYRVTLFLRDRRKLVLGEMRAEDEAERIARQIGVLLGVPVERKS